MLTFSNFLNEAQEINIARKVFKNLSSNAQYAINSWEAANWIGGPLENHFKSNDDVAKEIIEVFAPVRDVLRKRYGNSIRLYRGMKKGGESKNRVLESWTSELKVAEHFAGLRNAYFKSILYDEITDEEIRKVVRQYETKGFVTFRNKKYIRNKEMPKYYNIYDHRNQFITDGDNLEKHLKYEQEWIKGTNDEKRSKAIILDRKIPIDRIVWLTNNLDSKEFIVRV